MHLRWLPDHQETFDRLARLLPRTTGTCRRHRESRTCSSNSRTLHFDQAPATRDRPPESHLVHEDHDRGNVNLAGQQNMLFRLRHGAANIHVRFCPLKFFLGHSFLYLPIRPGLSYNVNHQIKQLVPAGPTNTRISKLLMGFEPMTSSLPRTRSTTELQQHQAPTSMSLAQHEFVPLKSG